MKARIVLLALIIAATVGTKFYGREKKRLVSSTKSPTKHVFVSGKRAETLDRQDSIAAERLLEEKLLVSSDDDEAHFQLADVYYLNHDERKATALFEARMKRLQSSPELEKRLIGVMDYAIALAWEGRTEEALEILDREKEKYPADPILSELRERIESGELER